VDETTGAAAPTVLNVVNGLPRNASGKVMKSALRGQLG
jgi:acyl-coenzyme A synthetase/AMP-(fatty) acid ligase